MPCPRRRGPARAPRPRLKVWVVFGGALKFGDGRAELFELIFELGSLQQAVRRMGMSYRAAWGYCRELERSAGFKLLERRAGGGTRLTPRGRRFLASYHAFRQGLDALVEQHFRRSFR